METTGNVPTKPYPHGLVRRLDHMHRSTLPGNASWPCAGCETILWAKARTSSSPSLESTHSSRTLPAIKSTCPTTSSALVESHVPRPSPLLSLPLLLCRFHYPLPLRTCHLLQLRLRLLCRPKPPCLSCRLYQLCLAFLQDYKRVLERLRTPLACPMGPTIRFKPHQSAS